MMAPATRGLAPVRSVLGNGMVVTVKDAPTTPAVTISAALCAGSLYEPDAQLGTAYFLSRVIDRGTERHDAEAIADQFENRGVSLNVTVSRHMVTLTCTCLAEDFDTILELVSDIVRGPTFPGEEIAKRRAEIVTLIRQDEDNPAVCAMEGLMALVYPEGHQYGRRGKGTVDTVERIDRPTLLDFHRRYFAPSAMSLVIVGDTRPAAAIDLAERVFGDWIGTPAPAPPLADPAPPTGRRRIVFQMMNKAQADIAYGFAAVARTDPAYHACTIMNHVLGQYSLGGRLGDSIRERQGMAYYVFSSFEGSFVKGPLVIRAGVGPANVDRAIASIDEEVSRMASKGVTPEEVAEVRRYFVGSLPRMLETNTGIATFLQTAEQFHLGLDYDLQLPGLLDAVTVDDVCSVARRVLLTDRAAVVIAGPYGGT